MEDRKRPRSTEEIRNLIEEMDRMRDEALKTREWVERAMKRPSFWPDRRNPDRLSDRSESHPRREDDWDSDLR